MAPIRSKDSQNEDASTSNQGRTKSRKHKRMQNEDAPVGVSKIKSALRQTRRLLAKEGLAADVRVESERKLKALETDLVAAEKANKERALATRYHKVKFFDRQKLIRKIKQTKRRLEEDGVPSKVRKALGAELFELRVDPKLCSGWKSTSRFSLPMCGRQDGATAPVHSVGSSSATDDKRETLREWVRGQMRAGKMASEPETLERKQPAQQSPAELWQSAIGEEDSGANEGTDEVGEERSNVSMLAEVPAKRRQNNPTTRLDKYSETTEKHLKKAKRKRHRGQVATTTPIIQDSFFDKSE
ncbi:hypothetical protein H4582DRAFT_2073894 [Lactarius indigo]|nr:hypothetical protein H4582DRAFT_2073894 [Lactarius indigo]